MANVGGVVEPGGEGGAQGCRLGGRGIRDGNNSSDANRALRGDTSNIGTGLDQVTFQGLAWPFTSGGDARPALLCLKDKVLGPQHEVEVAATLVMRAAIGLLLGVILQRVTSRSPNCSGERADRRLLITPPRAIGPIPARSDVFVHIDPTLQDSLQRAEPGRRRHVFFDEHAHPAVHDAERAAVPRRPRKHQETWRAVPGVGTSR